MRLTEKATIENAKELRINAMEEIDKKEISSIQDEMEKRMYDWWGTWQPDYEGWLKCADSLYAPNAVINAIGGEQIYSDYRTSMKDQRDRCSMEMGPILQSIVSEDTVALCYEMYLTPKGLDNPPVFTMMVTEFNKFEEVDGKLMVTRLDLYTDGGNMPQ
ncbi:MAG: hypothetical protein K5675_10195 [Lachnospiraceae bacterium]|nr:hypothetical protein [Lachnospiraceae bacterium]